MIDIPPFPEVWDSTMHSALIACKRQAFWSYLRHLRRPGLSIDLHFGGAIAAALEAMRKAFYIYGTSLDEAVCIGHAKIIDFWGDADFDYEALRRRRKYKSLPAAHDALEAYIDRWPLDTDDLQPLNIGGELMLEKTFALPIPDTSHPLTGEPILYSGRCDMIANWQETGTIFIDDEKTSSGLGRDWRANWRLRGQFTGYKWGTRSYGLNVKGIVIRGLGILSESIQTDEVIEMRPDWMVDQWLRQLSRNINQAASLWVEMAATVRDGHPEWEAWDQAFDQACTSYGGCQFQDLCLSQHPERWLNEYEVHKWNPLQRESDEK